MIEPDQVRMLMRSCRGHELGAGCLSRSLAVMNAADPSLTMIHDEVYSRNATAVAFHAVARAMAFGSDNVSSFEECVNQLGAERVRKAALAAGLLAAVPERKSFLLFDYDKFQKRCIFTAFLLETIAQRTDGEMAGDAFVTGLLMDGCYLLFLEFFEADFELSLQTRQNNPDMLATEAEEMYVGFNHCQVATVLAEDAKLCQAAIEGLRYHHAPSDCEEKYRQSADICHLVSVMADTLSLRLAPSLQVQKFDSQTIPRLKLGTEFNEHIKSAVDYSMEIANLAVAEATRAIATVRRFAA